MKMLPFLFFISSLTACAGIPLPLPSPEQAAKARANFHANTCNYDGAFEWGRNEAQNNTQMNGQGLAAYCPPETRRDVLRGYRAGYLSLANHSDANSTVIIVSPPRAKAPRECLDAYGGRVTCETAE